MKMEQLLRNFLEERGFFGAQTDAIVNKVKALPALSTMAWSDDQRGYPKQMVATIYLVAKQCATEWMDEECPEHFARALL